MQTIESQVRDSIRGFLQDNFLYMRPDFVLDDDARLLEQGVIDSMGVLEMMTFIEDTHGVKVEDHEVSEANLGTLNAVAQFVAHKQARSAAAA